MSGRKGGGQRSALSPERILAAAIKQADEHGIDALSMRTLAARLGYKTMSLYNYFASKDELLDAMHNRIVAEIKSPQPGMPWRDALKVRAISLHEMLLRHTWAPGILLSHITMGDAVMQDAEAVLRCLADAGFSYKQADWARTVIDAHVYGFTLQEIAMPVMPEDYQDAAQSHVGEVDLKLFPHLQAATMEIISGAYDGVVPFEFGLDLILAGLEDWLAR